MRGTSSRTSLYAVILRPGRPTAGDGRAVRIQPRMPRGPGAAAAKEQRSPVLGGPVRTGRAQAFLQRAWARLPWRGGGDEDVGAAPDRVGGSAHVGVPGAGGRGRAAARGLSPGRAAGRPSLAGRPILVAG